ncbi:MAG: hypothetical protein QG675_183, partial [Patescibacteria group bacterium]|nr:hypothetical protein [Patescibacteria group bacterium]
MPQPIKSDNINDNLQDAGDLPVSPTKKDSALAKAGGPEFQADDTAKQKANKTASKAIDQISSGGKSGGGASGAGGKSASSLGGKAGGGGMQSADKALKHLDHETAEQKSAREGSTKNTALKGTGAAVGAVAGGTAGAQVGAKVGEELAKGDRLKWIAAIIITPTIIAIAIPVFIISYIVNNPWDAVREVLTDSKLREFGLDVAEAFGRGALQTAIEAITYTGEVEYKGENTAIAVTAPSNIPAGSTLEKLSKIDWKKSQYQTLDNSNCGYELKLKQVVNAQGERRHIPESVINTRTRATIPLDQLADKPQATFCIQKQYPIFNLMARQPVTREINQKAQVYLNYASEKDTEEFDGDYGEVEEYVYDKTLDRVTPAKDDSIDFEPYTEKINAIRTFYKRAVLTYNQQNPNDPVEYNEEDSDMITGINKMYDDMKEGTSPYDMQIEDYINVPRIDQGPSELAQASLATTMCPFVYAFLDIGEDPTEETSALNARRAIESRLASTERGATKINTLADTRKADQLSNVENNVTIRQQDNWASSTSYQLDVYNQLRGESQNPEATSTRSYNAKQTSLLYEGGNIQSIKDGCDNITDESSAVSIIGGVQIQVGYLLLKAQILANSEGYFESLNDFGMKEIITSFVRTGSVTAVSGLEGGPSNYNRQAAGFRQLMNDYYLRIGGRFLDAQEAQAVAIQSEDTRRQEEKDGGLAYRLFDSNNIRSAHSIISQNTISPKTAMTATGNILKQILNPLKSLADIHSSTLYYATGNHNRAFAANINGDQYLKIDTAGVPEQDFNIDMLDNATIIENIKANGSEEDKTKMRHYDECFKRKIPTSQYFQYRVKPIGEVDPELQQSTLDKYPGARFVAFFVFYPEYHKGVLDENLTPVEGDDLDGLFNKFYNCRVVLQDAKDFSNPAFQLPIRYRMYTYYNTILDQMVSLSSDEDNQSIYARSSSSGSTDVLTEDVQELARQILQKADEGRITFDPGTRETFQAVADGQPAPTDCGNAGTPSVVPKASILQLILDVASQTNIPPMRISAFTDACHTSGSHHYQGRSIDIGNEEIAGALMPYLFTNRDRLKIDDLFFDPLPQYTVDNGVPFGRTVGGHSN